MRTRFILTLSMIFAVGSAAAQTGSTPIPIALTGTAAPDGGNYSAFDGYLGFNASGQVAFTAYLSGGTSSRGIFAGTPGSLTAAALQGTAAPAGGNYTDILGNPVLNDSGLVAFYAQVSGVTVSTGIFVGIPGSVTAAALQGTPILAGGNYGSFNSDPVLSASGLVAFSAFISGGTSTQGIFVGIPGWFNATALTSTAAPDGGNYASLTAPVLNASGQVAYTAFLSGGTSILGLFVGTLGSVNTVALRGTAAPDGGNYSSFGSPVLNDSGQVAFVANLSGGTSTQGIFVGTPGSVTAVALQGTAAPAGGNYSAFNSGLVLNASGQVAFTADLTGGTSTQGIFVGTPGSVTAVALQGTAAPAGGNYSSFGSILLLNASGQVAFLATLSGTGVTTANDTGLYAGSAGNLVNVVRTGDLLDVDPTAGVDLRTVSAISVFGFNLNDSGVLAYSLTFTDGSSGIFTSSATPVPEPTGLLMAAVLFGAAGRAYGERRRRRNLMI